MNSYAWVCALAWLAAPPLPLPQQPAAAPAPEVPSYTNTDLDRVSGRPDRNGTTSRPAHRLPPATGGRERPGPEAEQRWREEARRLREELERIDDQVRALRDRIGERRREPGVRPYTDRSIASWEERVLLLEERRRERWARFQRRARRAGIPPGWLR